MIHSCDVLQFVIDSLNDGSFPQQQPIRDARQRSFHVALEFRYQLYAVHEKPLEEILADIPFICPEFVEDHLYESPVLERFPVIDIFRRNHEVQQFAFLVAYQVQLESEEPSHRTLAPDSKAIESLVDVNAQVLADAQ